jgi:DNA-binding NarL/FixJ family response regulator
MTLIRVLILSPNLVLRIGLREMLRGIDEVVVVGEASSLAEFNSMDTEADILLMAAAPVDWLEPGGSAATFHTPQAVLLLSDDLEFGKALIGRAGLWGMLPADPSPEELSAGIRALREGLAVFPPRLAATLFRQASRTEQVPLEALVEPLTPREVEILGLIAQGLANKQIAVRLGISDHTVKFHLSSVYAKLGANSRTEAVRLGTLQGLIVI